MSIIKCYRQLILLFFILVTGMFLVTVQVFLSSTVDAKRQSQSTTAVCNEATGSYSTTICIEGQLYQTSQTPAGIKKTTLTPQDSKNTISMTKQTKQMPAEGQTKEPKAEENEDNPNEGWSLIKYILGLHFNQTVSWNFYIGSLANTFLG